MGPTARDVIVTTLTCLALVTALPIDKPFDPQHPFDSLHTSPSKNASIEEKKEFINKHCVVDCGKDYSVKPKEIDCICQDGYFRKKGNSLDPSVSHCLKCSNCPKDTIQKRRCNCGHDLHCCPKGQKVVEKDGRTTCEDDITDFRKQLDKFQVRLDKMHEDIVEEASISKSISQTLGTMNERMERMERRMNTTNIPTRSQEEKHEFPYGLSLTITILVFVYMPVLAGLGFFTFKEWSSRAMECWKSIKTVCDGARTSEPPVNVNYQPIHVPADQREGGGDPSSAYMRASLNQAY